MNNSEPFDKYAKDYNEILNKSISVSGEEGTFFSELKIKLLSDFLKNRAKPLNILDFGCGIGNSTKFVKDYFSESNYVGIDSSLESIKVAKLRYPNSEFYTGSEETLKDRKFDLIFSACVFHHIPPKERLSAIKNVLNLLEDKGYFILFEHNPYNPITVNIVRNSPIDNGVILLKPRYSKKLFQNANLKVERLIYYFFFPKFLSFMRHCERFMHSLPFGGQYMIIGKKE